MGQGILSLLLDNNKRNAQEYDKYDNNWYPHVILVYDVVECDSNVVVPEFTDSHGIREGNIDGQRSSSSIGLGEFDRF